MNVGIIAACLPTLKPLVAGFLGAVSALTSGERYGSRYANTGQSRPYVSNGYLKQSERSGTQSYAMDDIKTNNTGNSRSNPGSPYEEEYKDGVIAYGSRQRRGSRAAESDESILALHKGIMRTTEVQVS